MDAILYSDGSSDRLKNGGWAAVILRPATLTEIVGFEEDTTNNRMEMRAVIEGLRALPEGITIAVVSDSAYVLSTLQNKWYEDWFEMDANPIFTYKRPNIDLWRELVDEVDKRVVQYVKVKGHTGDKYNEVADKLAHFGRIARISKRRELSHAEPYTPMYDL